MSGADESATLINRMPELGTNAARLETRSMTTTSNAATKASHAPQIRTLTADDLPSVAQLFQLTFRNTHMRAPESLQTYLGDVFLGHPWYDPDMASRVYVGSDQQIHGFIGVLPVRLSFRGRPVRAAAAGSLMVDNPQQDPMAGARLLKSFLSGPQELSFSETSNPLSQTMWEKLGGGAMAPYSMEWVRPLRPVGLALALASERLSALRLLHRPVAILDRMLDAANPSFAFPPPQVDRTRAVDVSDDVICESLAQLSADYALHPDWSDAALRWQLAHAARKEKYGNLVQCLVMGRNNSPIGCYVMYARRDGIAFVLQMLARKGALGDVIDRLLIDAQSRGCVAVRGRTQPDLMNALLQRRCIMMHRSSLTIKSSNMDLLDAISRGDALLTGLAGESWTRLIGGIFE